MIKTTNKRKWRNFFICNDIQLRIAIYNLIFIFFIIGAVIATTLVPLYFGFQNSDNLSAQHFSAKFFIAISEKLAVAFIAIVVAGFIFNVLITHRFCGPLINFNKTFHKIAQGNLDCKIYLRPNDFLKGEADQINEMIDALSANINDLKQYNYRLQKKLEELMNASHNFAQSGRSLPDIKSLVDSYEKTLNHFNTSETSHLPVIKN